MRALTAAGPVLSLRPGEVHVWIVEPERVQAPGLLEAYRALLDEGELHSHLRFRFERHRHLYLVSHALVRTTLSRYAPLPPESWRFTTVGNGRPEVAPGLPRLRFNLSHTEGMAACAVALEADVGVDVENAERHGQTVELADRFFSPSETAALRALPTEHQRARFFEYWTLKESYIKARSLGLELPLDQFAFHLEEGRRPRISFGPRILDDSQGWQFAQLWPSRRYPVAVALRRARGLGLELRWQRTVPLEADEPAELLRLPPES